MAELNGSSLRELIKFFFIMAELRDWSEYPRRVRAMINDQ